jgi:hypothetical protein
MVMAEHGDIIIRGTLLGKSSNTGVAWGATAATVYEVIAGEDVQPDLTIEGLPAPAQEDSKDKEDPRPER